MIRERVTGDREAILIVDVVRGGAVVIEPLT
jgi:hypothetical protein